MAVNLYPVNKIVMCTEAGVRSPATRQAGVIGQECLRKSYQANDLE